MKRTCKESNGTTCKKSSKEASEEKESNTEVWEKAKKYKENTQQPQIVDKAWCRKS